MALKLNQYLQAESSPINNRPPVVTSIEFDTSYEVQQKKLKASTVNLQNLVSRNVSNGATADFSLGSILTLSSTLVFNPPNQGKPVFGIPYPTIYEGTVQSSVWQIYPVRGGSVTHGRYDVMGALNGHVWSGTTAVWGGMMTDTTGTSSTVITFLVEWQYLRYSSSNAT